MELCNRILNTIFFYLLWNNNYYKRVNNKYISDKYYRYFGEVINNVDDLDNRLKALNIDLITNRNLPEIFNLISEFPYNDDKIYTYKHQSDNVEMFKKLDKNSLEVLGSSSGVSIVLLNKYVSRDFNFGKVYKVIKRKDNLNKLIKRLH